MLNLLAVSHYNGFDWRDSAEYYGTVIKQYGKMLLKNPRSYVFVSMANTCLGAGLVEMAYEVVERGLKRHPNLTSAVVCKARILIKMGKYDGAFDILLPIAEKLPENVNSRKLLAFVCLKTEKYNEGLKWLDEIKGIWPVYRPPERLHRALKAGLLVEDIPEGESAEAGSKMEPGAMEEPGRVEGSVEKAQNKTIETLRRWLKNASEMTLKG